MLSATAMARDETARSRWEALETLIGRPLPPGVSCATGVAELERLAAAPADVARANEHPVPGLLMWSAMGVGCLLLWLTTFDEPDADA